MLFCAPRTRARIEDGHALEARLQRSGPARNLPLQNTYLCTRIS